MDPLSAISLAGNVVTFADFAIDILAKGNELYLSTSGALARNTEIEGVARRVVTINRQLLLDIKKLPSNQSKGHGSCYQSLRNVLASCSQLADELLALLDDLKIHGNRGKWKSLQQAIKATWKQDKIDKFVAELAGYRQEIVILLQVVGR